MADKVKAYVKCLVEQPVEKVKQMNVKVLFKPAEMSALWNFMKRWIAKASPETKKKWQALKDMPARGGEVSKNLLKLRALNLALVRRDWEELMVTDVTDNFEETTFFFAMPSGATGGSSSRNWGSDRLQLSSKRANSRKAKILTEIPCTER